MSERSGEFAGLPGAALVTGASGAVGSAVCRLLEERGARWVGGRRGAGTRPAEPHPSASHPADSRPADPRATGSRPSKPGPAASMADASLLRVDLTDPAEAERFVARAAERHGGLHTLVHAAGPLVPQTYMSRVDPVTLREHLEAEAAAYFNVLAPALPFLRESGGSIVAVTTVANRRFPLRDGLSGGPKAAVEGITRAIAAEEGRFGVRANCVGPGILADGMTSRLLERGDVSATAIDEVREAIPLRRLGSAEDVAEAVCFLASPRAAYITGQIIDVDGGYSI